MATSEIRMTTARYVKRLYTIKHTHWPIPIMPPQSRLGFNIVSARHSPKRNGIKQKIHISDFSSCLDFINKLYDLLVVD